MSVNAHFVMRRLRKAIHDAKLADVKVWACSSDEKEPEMWLDVTGIGGAKQSFKVVVTPTRYVEKVQD